MTGKYDTVSCVDVAIHYPTDQMSGMIGHLCSLSDRRVLFSFAPKTWYYVALKKVGELFPGPSKTTRAYLHEEQVVRDALEGAGFKISREEFTGTNSEVVRRRSGQILFGSRSSFGRSSRTCRPPVSSPTSWSGRRQSQDAGPRRRPRTGRERDERGK